MLTGFVKYWNENRGYGFASSDGEDYFFHVSMLSESCFKLMRKGLDVQFDVQPGDKGPMAVSMIVMEPSCSFRDAAINK